MSEFNKGDRVKLKKNVQWKPQRPDRVGTIHSGKITNWNGIAVIWDGGKGGKSYHNIHNLETV